MVKTVSDDTPPHRTGVEIVAWKGTAPGAQLPASLPAQERKTIAICEKLVLMDGVMWGAMPSMLLRFDQDPGDRASVALAVKDLSMDHGDVRAVDGLNLVAQTLGRPADPHTQRGVALFAEAMAVDPALQLPPGQSLRDFFDDHIASGTTQSLDVVGVLTSGWQFLIERVRPDRTATITVVEPGELWPEGELPEVLELLVDIDARLANRQ